MQVTILLLLFLSSFSSSIAPPSLILMQHVENSSGSASRLLSASWSLLTNVCNSAAGGDHAMKLWMFTCCVHVAVQRGVQLGLTCVWKLFDESGSEASLLNLKLDWTRSSAPRSLVSFESFCDSAADWIETLNHTPFTHTHTHTHTHAG